MPHLPEASEANSSIARNGGYFAAIRTSAATNVAKSTDF